MKLSLGRKGIVRIGIVSSILLALIFLGIFVYTSILPAKAVVTPGNVVGGAGVALNLTVDDSNNVNNKDTFFAHGNRVWLIANFSCANGDLCAPNMTVTANFTQIGGDPGRFGVPSSNGSQGGNWSGWTWAVFDFNETVNFSNPNVSANLIGPATINITARSANSSNWMNMSTTIVLVNMTTPPGCPPAGTQLPPQVPLLNGTFVPVGACWTNCSIEDRVQPMNSTHYQLCGMNFGGSTTNFTQVAEKGNFSNFNFTIDIPGKSKINFLSNVSMDTQQKAQGLFEFAMKNVMSGGKIGVNDTEWGGGDVTKPNLNLSARLTIYNMSGRFGINPPHAPFVARSAFNANAPSVCPPAICSGIGWDGENFTFTVSSFSEYSTEQGISVVLQTPGNFSFVNTRNVNFTFLPRWNSSVIPKNATLFGNFTSAGFAANQTNTTFFEGRNNTVMGINNTVSTDGPYLWNIRIYDNNTVLNDTGSWDWSVTVDTLAPTIKLLTPQNGTYIYGSSSQLFDVNATELNFNTSATNVTLWYKKSTTGTWTSTNMSCFAANAAPDFRCNTTTVDLSIDPYTEGSVVQYFFNYSDPATNAGNNGTQTAFHNVTIDKTPPARADIRTNDTDNVIGISVPINLSVQWTDVYALSAAILETNETTDFQNKSQIVLSGQTAFANFTWSNSSSALVGKVISWKIYANDSVGNQNKTENQTFLIDNALPQWSSNQTSTPASYVGSISMFNVTWTDDVGMSSINASRIEHNFTVAAGANYTMTDFGSGIYTYNDTLGAAFYWYRFLGNDSSGNVNSTPYFNFTIAKSATSISVFLNGTQGNRSYNWGQGANFTSSLNVSGKTVGITTNITGWNSTNASGTTPLLNYSVLPLTATVYNITGNWSGDTNYTSAWQTYFATVYGWANSSITLNKTWIKQGEGIQVQCLVRDSNTSTALEGYYVEVYNGTTNLTDSAGRTSTNGWLNTSFVPRAEGQQTAKCAVYNNVTSYYNISLNGSTTFTSDFTTPTLASPTPANNTYIYGSSSQLFQINVTDTNLNLTTNATVSYRLASWTNVVLNCWPDGSTGRYTCNKTISLAAFGEADVIQFYFNATDNATNTGFTNSTPTAFFNVTIDRSPPTRTDIRTNDTDNVIGTSDPINLSVQWTDVYSLSAAILETNETTDYQNKSQIVLSGQTAFANFTWSNSSAALVGKVISWKIYANDSVNNQNKTDNQTFTIESAPPRWGEGSNVTTVANGTQYSPGATYRFNITVSDSVGVDKVLLEWRNSSGITNYSATRFNGTATDGSWSVTFVDLKANETGYQFKWFMNDTTNNQNTTTSLISYFVMKAGTNVTLYLNGSWANQTIAYGQSVNMTSTLNVSTLTYNMTRNGTLVSVITGSISNITTADFIGNRTYIINATFHGNENYTSDIDVLYVNVNKANSSIDLWLNTTAGNATYNKSIVVGQNAQTNSSGNINIYNNFTGTLILVGSANNTLNVTNGTSTLSLANYTVLVNVTGNENYTDAAALTYYVTLVDSIVPGISAASVTPTGVYRYQNITINATITDNDFVTWPNNFAWTRIGFANGSYVNANVSLTNYTSTDWSATFNNSNFTLGANNVTVYANDSSRNINSSVNMAFTLWGLSNLSQIIVPSSISSSVVTTLACFVGDRNTTQGINNYPISFYQNDSTLLTTNNTNSTGWAIHAYSQAIPAGYSIKCNLTANSTLYYNLTEFSSLSATTAVTDTTPPTVQLPVYTNATAKQAGASLTLNVSVSETGSGIPAVTTCNVTVGGTSAGQISYASNWCNGTITLPSLTEGNKTINITINDTGNNVGFNDSYVVTIDNTTSVLTVNYPLSNRYVKMSGAYIWINGTIYDTFKMGTGNISTNDTRFVVNASYQWMTFNGSNNTVFNITNTSSVTDGYVALNISYLDAASNNGSVVISFYSDNTAPSVVVGLRNSTSGRYQPNASQSIVITITDNLKTNDTITLYYWANGTGNTTVTSVILSGTPGTTTTYTTNVSTSGLIDNQKIMYYITGVDNATNSIAASVGGSATSPLASIIIDEYCGNNGVALKVCSGNALTIASGEDINTYHFVRLMKEKLEAASSLSSNYNVSNVLTSISGKYSYVYHKNITSSGGIQWYSYDPNIAWSLNTLRFANNTNDEYYINATTDGAIIRIS